MHERAAPYAGWSLWGYYGAVLPRSELLQGHKDNKKRLRLDATKGFKRSRNSPVQGLHPPREGFIVCCYLHGVAYRRQHGLNLAARVMLLDAPQIFGERVSLRERNRDACFSASRIGGLYK